MVKRNEAENVEDQVEGGEEAVSEEGSEQTFRTRKIGGHSVRIPQPYREGHVLTAGEAVMVNSAYAEAFTNNLRDKIGNGITEGEGENAKHRDYTAEEAQAIVDAYAANYVPGSRPSRGEAADPREVEIDREARKLAEADVLALLSEQGLKRKEVAFKDIVAGALEDDTSYRARATELVDARRNRSGLNDDMKAKLLARLG